MNEENTKALLGGVNYSYSYCTEKMISDIEKETGIKYPDVMESVDYEIFKVKAINLEEANVKWLEFQKALSRIFELDEEIETDGKDEYLPHKLKQDWDTYYFDPNDT